MERKRIDFNTPLLSVRRFHSSIADSKIDGARSKEKEEKNKASGTGVDRLEKKKNASADGDDRIEKRSMLPFYKADLNSGPLRNPGVVPFFWEKSPGHPKVRDSTVKLSDRINSDVCAARVKDSVWDGDDDGDDSFLDAVETLSRTDSCSMNCSVSEMSRVGEPVSSGNFLKTDPQVRDFMMGRFLPAAQAMVTESPIVTLRKTISSTHNPTIERGAQRTPVSLPRQTQPNDMTKYPHLNQTQGVDGFYHHHDDVDDDDDDDDEDDAFDDHHTRHMVMKGCGFLLPKFCLKTSLRFMNHSPSVGNKNRAMAASLSSRQRFSRPVNTSANQGHPVAEIRHETWEAVFRYRTEHGIQPMQKEEEEEESKFITNSQSSTEFSQFHRSTCRGTPPHMNNASQSSFREGKGFLGVPVGSDRNGKAQSTKSISGSLSPAVEKTVYVDSACMMPVSSVNTDFQFYSIEKDNEVSEESGIILEGKNVRDSEIVSNDKSCPRGKVEIEEKDSKLHNSIDCSTTDFSDCCSIDDGLQFIHPPLPISPSESWLQRTLPSISSKNQSSQTLLGMQSINSKNEIAHLSSSAGTLLKNTVKTSVVHTSWFSEHENKD